MGTGPVPELAPAAAVAAVQHRVGDWAAFAAAVAARRDAEVELLVRVASGRGGGMVGRVMKVDGHRVRVDFTASGGKQRWTTKRDLLVLPA